MNQFLQYASWGLDYFLMAVICALSFGAALFHFLMGCDNPHTAGSIVFFRPKTFLSPRGQWYRLASIWCLGLLVVVALARVGVGKLLGLD